ncbi:MAG: type II secretion system protein [Lentisphaerae bacterium]|nr:type II secretion system protein [Lentisphaerota bacterium]
MKRYYFTATELLAVIAVILILAALGGAVLINSRAKARLASCASNQGQTMKMIISAMGSSDSRITAGNTDDTRYTKWLKDKGLLQSLTPVRCTDLSYGKTPDKTDDDAALAEAYGVVTADSASNGKFNFKSNKLRKFDNTVDIPPASLLIGGCTAKNTDPAPATANLDFSTGKLIAVHTGKTVNVFFFDGSVSSLNDKEFKAKKFFSPKADNSGAQEVDSSKLLVP